VPVSMLGTTCFPTGYSGHSWGNVTVGISIGHKGRMQAAKIMAVTAVGPYSNPDHLVEIRQEFEKATKNKKYTPPMRHMR
jgi:aminobenzoyl-glutamate utilization protein B